MIPAWLIRAAQAHPGRVLIVGFLPALVYLGYVTIVGTLRQPLMGLFLIPLLLGGVGVVLAMGKLAELSARLERDRRDTSGPRNER